MKQAGCLCSKWSFLKKLLPHAHATYVQLFKESHARHAHEAFPSVMASTKRNLKIND
jgi:hypothetical protein